MKKTARRFVVATILAGTASLQVHAATLLINGDLEAPLTPPGWLLSESITGLPGVTVDATQWDHGRLWLKAFAGHTAFSVAGQNRMINATLSQTVGAVAGETYTLTGHSLWEENYSGGVTTLDSASPSGTIASPTESTFEMAFLDGADAVLGSPVTLDLRTVQSNISNWAQHSLSGMAPLGTAKVRVTAAATDMVFNVDPGQSAFIDDFSLTPASAPATELLSGGSLDSPPTIPGWTLIESPEFGNTAGVEFGPYVPHTGGRGLWLKSFANGDASLTQTVPGTPGLTYTFSSWSKWEGGYSGGVTILDPSSNLGAVPSPTETTMEIAFLDSVNAVIGLPITLDLRTVQVNDNTWRQHSLNGVAPVGTVSVQVTLSAQNMVQNVDLGGTLGNQSAFFDDFQLTAVPEPTTTLSLLVGAALLVRMGWPHSGRLRNRREDILAS